MRAVYKNLYCKSRKDVFTIIPIGDVHIGARSCNLKKLKDIVEYVRTKKNCYWIGMGDYLDSINLSDKRFSQRDVDDTSELDDLCNSQAMRFIEIMKPIADKCLGLLGGNHEETVKKRYHQDLIGRLCMGLKVDNLTYSCLMRLYFKRQGNKSNSRPASKNVVIFAHHGHGGGRAVSGKLNMVLGKAKSYDADVYLVGHCHLKANLDGERICMSHGKGDAFIYAKKQLFCTTGSFMESLGEGYSPYSEIAGYEPIPTGVIKLTIEPFRMEVRNINNKKLVRDLPVHVHASV